jgi:hypothetical protein
VTKQSQRTGSKGSQVGLSVAAGRHEVVAGQHPHLAADLDAHLRRAEDVAGRMQAHARVADGHRLAPVEAGDVDAPEARAQHADAALRGQVVAMAGARVVGVGVRDDGALDLAPRVDVEVAGRAIEALRAPDDQVSGHGTPESHAGAARQQRRRQPRHAGARVVTPARDRMEYCAAWTSPLPLPHRRTPAA